VPGCPRVLGGGGSLVWLGTSPADDWHATDLRQFLVHWRGAGDGTRCGRLVLL